MEIKEVKIGCKNAYLRIYRHEKLNSADYAGSSFPEKRHMILIIPGGGYIKVSEREAEPIAIPFFASGYDAAVLYYTVGDDIAQSSPIKEASDALSLLKELDGLDKFVAIGFSAGAHLAAMLASHGTKYDKRATLDALVLSYPVISMGPYAHESSHDYILKEGMGDENYYSAELNVTPSFPPTYIWSTRDDATVDIRNSLLMYNALIDKGIYSELHIFPKGLHGLSTATIEGGFENKMVSRWIEEVLTFLDSVF